MTKLFAITFVAIALAACSSTTSMGNTGSNPAETKNSTDANKASNPAAVSPGPGAGTGTGAPGATK